MLVLDFNFNYHFSTDDLLYKIIVLKEAKINTASCNPNKNKKKKQIIPCIKQVFNLGKVLGLKLSITSKFSNKEI